MFKSWKTTVFGLLGSALQAYLGGMNWKSIAMAAPTLIVGALAKDADVSGKFELGK